MGAGRQLAVGRCWELLPEPLIMTGDTSSKDLLYWQDHVNRWAAVWRADREMLLSKRILAEWLRAENGQEPGKYKPEKQPPLEVRDPAQAAMILHLIAGGATQWKAHRVTGVHGLEVGRVAYRHRDALMAGEATAKCPAANAGQ